jgi:hypothetical protein
MSTQSKLHRTASNLLAHTAALVVLLGGSVLAQEWGFDSTRLIDDINFSGPTLSVIFRW